VTSSSTLRPYLQQVTDHLRAGRLTAAEELATRLAAQHPDEPQVWNLRANVAFAAGQLPLARTMAERAIALAAGRPAFHFNHARILEDLGDGEGAVAAYREAVRLAPLWDAAAVRLGDLLFQLGREGEAAAAYRAPSARIGARCRPALVPAPPADDAADQPWAVSVFDPPALNMPAVFAEVAAVICHGLRELGLDATVDADIRPGNRRRIVLATGCLPNASQLGWGEPLVFRADTVLYQFEQAARPGQLLASGSVGFFRALETWDYSRLNVRRHHLAGLPAVRHVPLGYAPVLTHIAERATDVDVLFYGRPSERRQAVVDGLRRHGVRVEWPQMVFGEERDAWIARSRIVLNVHCYEAKIFELPRVLYLLANQRCVVSETGNDPDEGIWAGGVAFARHEELVATCLRLLEAPAERARIAAEGFRIACSRPMAEFLRDALTARGTSP
jgi:tetratricopeptide (TPR) repeat protein